MLRCSWPLCQPYKINPDEDTDSLQEDQNSIEIGYSKRILQVCPCFPFCSLRIQEIQSEPFFQYFSTCLNLTQIVLTASRCLLHGHLHDSIHSVESVDFQLVSMPFIHQGTKWMEFLVVAGYYCNNSLSQSDDYLMGLTY